MASCYVEQVGKNDLSRELAKDHNFRISDTIEDALTLGTGKLAVDGVLLICEHGEYPYNARGQKLYPRHEYFKQVVAVFEKSGKTVPVFCDKHLSYDRTKAADMVETARKMGFPLMAGSSLPVTWRRPELELQLGTKMSEASWRRAANWRSTASMRSKRCSAWSSGGSTPPPTPSPKGRGRSLPSLGGGAGGGVRQAKE